MYALGMQNSEELYLMTGKKISKGHCFLLNNTDSGKHTLFHFSLVA